MAMSNKGKPSVREAEIEKCREEGNWKRIIDLAEQVKQRSPSSEPLATFLISEARLEAYLEENPPTEANHERARAELRAVQRQLTSAASADPSQKVDMTIDAHLLLGKLHYAMGLYEDALLNLSRAGLDTLSKRQLPTRSLRVVAESYAVKGLCLEKVPLASTSKFKAAEREEAIISSFELASDLALLYLQEMDRAGTTQSTWSVHTAGSSSSPLPPPSENRLGLILETALQKAPILSLKVGQMPRAIQRYRMMLSAVETSATQGVRLAMARRLSEILLRGVSDRAYHQLDAVLVSAQKKSSVGGRPAVSPWKPRRQAGTNLFVPKDINEEIVLLLLISEALAVREAVLTQSPETREARHKSYEVATSVYDLMTMALVRKGQAVMLCESLERALRFSFEEAHVWQQYALSLVAAGRPERALLVLEEAVRLNPGQTVLLLLAARTCYQHLHQYEDGVRWSEQAAQQGTGHGGSGSVGLASRAHLYLGIGQMLLSAQSRQQQHKQRLADSAVDNFRRCHELDPGDHLASFYLGYQLARAREVDEAVTHVRTALQRRPDHLSSLHLLALLLTAENRHTAALELLQAAQEEYPEDLQLMNTRVHVEEFCNGTEAALGVAREMLEQWKEIYDARLAENSADNDRQYSVVSDPDSGSVRAPSTMAPSRVEQALSEVASSLNSSQPRSGPQQVWTLQIQIWLLSAELYLKLDQVSQAISCVQEASTIAPASHHVLYMKGLVHEYKHEFEEAKQHYSDALALNPHHIKSLQHIGLVHHYLGSHRLAEKMLRDAIQLEPLVHRTWYNLGKVLEFLGENEAAADCFMTAVHIEASAPVLPFTTVPLCFE
ncbi:tetratricopeptide repeat protein 7B-like isoform X1 [Amphibalanus amphitrite]|uniref:tetratricopeptide repeat protein 7B-like isoform X1 n=1 Tax=Amphibalanus amphitrite TaxID=1232801 RepID=UPI001C91ACE4|nr:tetratricopeptide repeat protein 7B-like isoform X1 [Amphibalanus amphitrite]XP_043210110.1 tetratricopeptide repeat protein 7B-like isoform X1 [Amphibalanus amphitrite]XP_043210111.1 tetratricopeptide repeat protein 7B-like isoform X1 [Amphibalanus amphitrite]